MTDKPREKALQILCSIEQGSFADTLLDQARLQFDHRDSAFILELVYGVCRRRSRLDWALEQFSAQPLSRTDLRTRNILRLAAYQMLHLDKVPVSAAVNTATELAKHQGRKSGYVNGVLRNLDRRRREITEPSGKDEVRRLSILHSHPSWLVRRWVTRFGAERAEALLEENNKAAPLVIRTNILRTTRDELKASLQAEGAVVSETQYSPAGLEMRLSPGLRMLGAYGKGWFMIQDEAAQLIARMVDPQPGEIVLDACAAPGGKATHLAELMRNSGSVVALEKDPGRMKRIKENISRLGTDIIKPALGDARTYKKGFFDKILVDAPCSGLGVLRRHPDGRWNKTEETIRERAALQRHILANCASLLKPGGVLVYSTCTTEPEENEEIIGAFLREHPDAFFLDDPGQHLPEPARRFVDERFFFRTFHIDTSLDGFFAARMIRKK